MFTTFPSHQSCLHVADSTPIICSPTIVSPTISPTHDIEISIPSNAALQLEHCPHQLHRILYEFSQVFSTNKYNVPKLNIPPVKINTTTDKIIALRPYRVPLHDQQEIQTQIEQMLQYGIIAPSVSPYASPITLVTKRDQTKRFCIDYRKLNEIIAPDVHPLPLIETILDKLSKAKYYSSVDIASAYWQVEIEPNSRNLLAFVTLDSQYEFCRLPYGFKNSPQIYHRAINQVMQKYKLNFVTHYFDDFIIFSDTLEDHLQHLQQFLTVCQHENIKLNYNKCSFFKTKIDFLGYTVTAGTYAPQTRNLDTINAIKPPNNQKTLQSFLGAVNVYNKFIADYARLRAPLNKLLKKDVKWNWNTDCQQAFTTLKESLTSKPVLHLYQVGLPCRLYCDASTQGIAGILKQVHPDGQIHPVQYFSRALRAHERNYTVSELECLAIVESVDKFRIYLTGIKFTIYTDHQALQWLKTIKNPLGRLFRWSLRLSTYNYEIHYIKGSQQYEADLLSRNPFVGLISTDIIKQHQPTASPFNIDTNGLHTITRKGVTKIIIPETLQHTLMNKVHQEYNHPGISQMTRIITTQYYWKGISKSIEKFVRSCHTCQIIKKPKGKPYGALGQIPPPQQPFDLISIDTIAGFSKYGHSKTYLHVIVDHLTRYAWTFPSKSTSTLTYIQTLKTVLQQGSPKRLLSDRAPAFTSEKFRKFLIMHGIQPLLTTSNNPQANGLIERLNATITGKLRLAYLENPKASWTQLVKRVTQTYNNTPHSVTSFPPTYLMFNVIPTDLRTHLNPYPEINIAREIASSRTQNKHKKDKETFDKQHRTPHFEENDLVLVKNYRHPDTDSWMQEGMTDRRVQSYPPQCTTSRADRQIVRMAVTDYSVTSRTVAQHIQSVRHHPVSARTIRRRLQQSGLSTRRALFRLPLTRNHRSLCRQWCDERRMWTAEWNEIVFTDESRFCLQHHDGQIRVLIHRGERVMNSCVIHRHTGLAPGIIVWGGIGYHSHTSLVHIAGNLNSQRYISELPHQIKFVNVWKLLGQLYPKNASKVSLNAETCGSDDLQQWRLLWLLILAGTTLRIIAPSRKKKKNAEKPIVTLAQLEMENEEVKQNFEQKFQNPHPTSRFYLLQSLMEFINLLSEQIKALIAEVENLSGTLASFKELDEIKPQTACHSTQTSPSPSCKETSTMADPTKPATPAPTKRKQPEAPYPPAKRTNLNGPAKPAPSRVPKPAAAQVVLHGEKSAAHTVVISDDPQADPRAMLKAVRAAHTLPQSVWASLRTKGKLVLHSSNPDTIPAVTTSLANKLDGMKVRQQKVILPRICLFKVDEETSNSTIEETLLETPAVSQLHGDKVVRVAHRSAPRNGTCTAFNEVDLTTFRALGNRGRIEVDGVILKFEESIRARVCFRCYGFGHNSAQCTRAPTCFHCGEGGHEGRACPSVADRQTSKCANCCAKGLPDKHEARASSCPILKLRALKF
ncbi:K02A2.6-like [Cordylochernes scorpioides]|uniref:RNA-directed DNA polymerase n=1 Tax=Cordylochernes scorpioides TaxID=51811 RepID=A0ABY6K6E5_9ARAC|nr:K02A2.6-like [Cordylochernes scorpioides]